MCPILLRGVPLGDGDVQSQRSHPLGDAFAQAGEVVRGEPEHPDVAPEDGQARKVREDPQQRLVAQLGPGARLVDTVEALERCLPLEERRQALDVLRLYPTGEKFERV